MVTVFGSRNDILGEILFVLLLFTWVVKCSVISKSNIHICENTANDPLNVVYNKKCEKKLVILAEVTSGQGETEKLHASVNKVRDSVLGEDARLYNPFIVTLSMTPIRLVYPIEYRATINNKPKENIIFVRTHVCEGDPCGVHVDLSTGKKLWSYKGFCCKCFHDESLILSEFYTFKHSTKVYRRAQMLCHLASYTAHCMVFDDLWYDAHEISVYSFDFTIWIKAYDQVETYKNNQTVVEWVDGGEIELSPMKTGGLGKHKRIRAKYIGKMKSGREYPRLQDHYLMTPNAKRVRFGREDHPQLIHGYGDYLIIPMSDVEINPRSHRCDVIGVSFTAFSQQSTYHTLAGYGCSQPVGTCLRNQIQDYFREDMERRQKGEKTKYFPETYGRITGIKERVGEKRDRVVEFESKETSSVLVLLEISADDMILVYNRAEGIILKAYAEGFESQSRNGKATVMVQNTGYVSADFFVSLQYCSNGINAGNEKSASINPQTGHKFEFILESYRREGGQFSCSAYLYDARRSQLDSRIIIINTTSTCVCILGCGCSCTDQENFVCVNESDVTFDQGKPGTYSDFMDDFFNSISGGIFGDAFISVAETMEKIVTTVITVVKGIWDFLPLLKDLWNYLIAFVVIIALIIFRVMWSFVPTGVFKIIAKTTFKAMKSPVKPPPAPIVVIVEKDSDSDEEKKTAKFLGANEHGEFERKSMLTFAYEFCFCFIFPVMMLGKGLKLLWKKTLAPHCPNMFEWLGKHVKHLRKIDCNSTKTTSLKKEKSGDNGSSQIYSSLTEARDTKTRQGLAGNDVTGNHANPCVDESDSMTRSFSGRYIPAIMSNNDESESVLPEATQTKDREEQFTRE